MYLIDTNVISATAPNKSVPQAELALWLQRQSDSLFLSAVSVAEIEAGIAKLRRTGAMGRADQFARWLEVLLHLYRPRIIPLDTRIARVLGGLSDLSRSVGRVPDYADLIIAATAICHGHTVLTRNLRHFRDMPVACHDPFDRLPTPG